MRCEFIGAAIGQCAGIPGCEYAPESLKKNNLLSFQNIFSYKGDGRDYDALESYLTSLGKTVLACAEKSIPFVVGGDHSCAVGTWSGVHQHYKEKNQDIGLIWVDAHMDSHTPQTTLTGNVHGMPLATLMGYGDSRLCNLLGDSPKLRPENVILLGIRSYEEAEASLLQSLGVRIYFMEEVQERSIDVILREAFNNLSARVSVGLSIDVDAFDPQFAPGVGTPEPNGINLNAFIKALIALDHSKICGVEIAEYNPTLDKNNLTQEAMMKLIQAFRKK